MASALTEDYWAITLPNNLKTAGFRSPYLLAYQAGLVMQGAPAFLAKQTIAELVSPDVVGKRAPWKRHHLFPKAHLARQGLTNTVDVNQVGEHGDRCLGPQRPDQRHGPRRVLAGFCCRSSAIPELPMRISRPSTEWHAFPTARERMDYADFLQARRCPDGLSDPSEPRSNAQRGLQEGSWSPRLAAPSEARCVGVCHRHPSLLEAYPAAPRQPRPDAVRGPLGGAAPDHRRARLRQDPGPRLADPEPAPARGRRSPARSSSARSPRRPPSSCATASRSTRKKVGYEGDLSDLLVGTIHGICNRFLLKYRHRTRLLARLRDARRPDPAALHLRPLRRDRRRARRERAVPRPLDDEVDRDRGPRRRTSTRSPRSSSIPSARGRQRTPSRRRSAAPTAPTSSSSATPTRSTSRTCRRVPTRSSSSPTSARRSPAASST